MPIELLFDIVFVLALSQVGKALLRESGALGIAQSIVLLLLLWWSWLCYVGIAAIAPSDQPMLKTGLMVATGAFLQLTLAIPVAFGGDSRGIPGPVMFVIAFGLVQAVRALFWRALGFGVPEHRKNSYLAMAAPLVATAIVACSLLVDGWGKALLMFLAFAADITIFHLTILPGTYEKHGFGSTAGWHPLSFRIWTERCAVAYLIALVQCLQFLETIAQSATITGAMLAYLGATLVVMYLFWRTYEDFLHPYGLFALNHFARTGGPLQSLASVGYVWCHLVMVGGLLVLAVNILAEFTRLDSALDVRPLVGMSVGVAACLVSQSVFRFMATRQWTWHRVIGSAVLLALIPLLQGRSALWELLALIAVLGAVVRLDRAANEPFASQMAAATAAAQASGA